MGKFQQIRKLDNLIQKYAVIFKIMILIRRYEIDFDPFFRRSSSDVACTALFLFSTPIPSEKSSNYRK